MESENLTLSAIRQSMGLSVFVDRKGIKALLNALTKRRDWMKVLEKKKTMFWVSLLNQSVNVNWTAH